MGATLSMKIAQRNIRFRNALRCLRKAKAAGLSHGGS